MMFVKLQVRDSVRANEILKAIQEKHKELDDLCYKLRQCLMLEAELETKKEAAADTTA